MNLPEKIQMRDAFITGLFARAQADKDIMLISNEFGAPALDIWRAQLPAQFINAGISEQNIIAVAAGMAHEGKKIYIYSIAPFITLRCFEQIKLDICVHHLPVTILGVGCGYAYSEDGPTHHASEDIALMRALAGIEILSPADAEQAFDFSTRPICAPTYIRFDKGIYPPLSPLATNVNLGYRILRQGTDLALCSTGIMVHRTLAVAAALASRGITSTVIDVFRLKPLDATLSTLLKSVSKAVTIEEHCLNGGLGSILAELIADKGIMLPLRRFAIPDDKLYAYGGRQLLHARCGLDEKTLTEAITLFFKGDK